MGLYLPSLMAAAGRPVTIAVGAAGIMVFLYLYLRMRKLAAIARHLSSLPAGKRRYVLEREYSIYPGTNNLPLAFLRGRQIRLRVAAAAALLTPVLTVGILSLQLWGNARRIVWQIQDPAPVVLGSGFVWDVEFRNRSEETIEIRRVELEIVASAGNPGARTAPSPAPAQLTEGRRIVILQEGHRRLTVVSPAEAFEVPPAGTAPLRLYVDVPGGSAQGRIDSVRLAVEWLVPGKTALLVRRSRLHPIRRPETSDPARGGD